MQQLTPERWQEWKASPVTVAVMEAVNERIDAAKDQLTGPNNERDFDQFTKGLIWAFNEVLSIKLDIPTERDEDAV